MIASAALVAALGSAAVPAGNADDLLRVRFLGVGGFLISYGGQTVLTAPLYSNPEPIRIGRDLGGFFFAPLLPSLARIEKFHPTGQVPSAILVGHGHYDHLMDVPEVWSRAAAQSRGGDGPMIYGSSTVAHILAGYGPREGFSPPSVVIPRDRIVALDAVADTRNCATERWTNSVSQCGLAAGREGKWIDVPPSSGTSAPGGPSVRVRILALCGQHPPQALGAVHFWPGCLINDRLAPPQMIDDFPEGPTLAYLIDFIAEGNRVAFRLFYQDSPSDGPVGQVPAEIARERRVDVGLLCAGNFDATRRPEEVVASGRMTHVILGHWEDFFRPQDRRVRPIPGLVPAAYEKRLRRVLAGQNSPCRVHRPRPQDELLFDGHLRRLGPDGAALAPQ